MTRMTNEPASSWLPTFQAPRTRRRRGAFVFQATRLMGVAQRCSANAIIF